MDKLDREGVFRARPLEFGIAEGKDSSQSVGVAVRFKILAQYNAPEGWDTMWENSYDVGVEGVFYIIKTDGQVIEDNIRRLIIALGWDGDLDSFLPANRDRWQPKDCQITVKNEPYQGQDRYRATWISDFAAEPGGGLFTIDPARISSIKNMHGAKLRAVAGNVARNLPHARPAGGADAVSSARIEIADVQQRDGEENGQAWKLFLVVDQAGNRYGTYDAALAGQIRDLQALGVAMDIKYSVNAKGNRKIVSIAKVESAAKSTETSDIADDLPF